MKTLKNTWLFRTVSLTFLIQLILFFDASGRGDRVDTGSGNDCSVEADFTPGRDSIITQANTSILFQNASLNATAYRFIINRLQYPQNVPVSVAIKPGIHTVQLVAYQGDCTDTITRHYFYAGERPSDLSDTRTFYGYGRYKQYVSDFKAIPGGGFAIAGYFADNASPNFPNQSFVLKLDEEGQVKWARIIKPNAYHHGRITSLAATKDGGMLMAGEYSPGTNHNYLMRLDRNGNLTWKKVTANDENRFIIKTLTETEDGGMIATGIIFDRPELVIARFDAVGNNSWTRLFTPAAGYISQHITVLHKADDVFVAGQVFYDQEEVIADGATVFKLDYHTGQIRWWRNYRSPTGYFQCRGMSWNGGKLLINGNTPSVHGGKTVHAFFTIDTAGNASDGFQVYALQNSNNAFSQMHPSGDGGYYVVSSGVIPPTNVPPGLQTRTVYHTITLRLKADFSVDWSYQHGELQHPFSAVGPHNSLAIVGEQTGYGIHARDFSWRSMLKKMHKAGHQVCGMFGDSAYTKPIAISSASFNWIESSTVTLYLKDTTVGFREAHFVERTVCPTDFVDVCSYAVVDGPETYCNTRTTYTYRLKRPGNCEQPVAWRISGPATIVSQSNSELSIKFDSLTRYVITAEIQAGNGIMMDSIVALPGIVPTPALNLGNDTTICANTSITLRASRHYLNYEWQDGSRDQQYIVDKPGIYSLKVTNLCGNELHDTIVVAPRLGIEVNAGPDLEKCAADSVQLRAPDGYLSYSWSPAYKISSLNTPATSVNPAVDTAYVIKAEKIPGCFAYDTVRIKINQSPPIYLGADTSICSGEYVSLDAGAGFRDYRWSDGQTSQSISGGTAGVYSVVATTKEGCTSSDTLEIVNVWEKPEVRISGARAFCSNESIMLNAGSFASYLWKDGSQTPEISVSNEGAYYVTVWDLNQCAGSDTVFVGPVLPIPGDFLPDDTIICAGESLLLQAPANSRNYLWNDGSVQSSKTITSEGNYWLQVKDQNNCMGKDSIFVKVRDCIKGLNIPTAFTPNGDGINDLFKPIIAGTLVKYQFTIFDRSGVMVFTSSEPGKGWDGKVNGNISAGSVYVWTCTYQIGGEAIQTARGSVFIVL